MGLKIEKNVPYPVNNTKELVAELLKLKEGDSVLFKFEDYSKTLLTNCIANARSKMAMKGLQIKSISNSEGRRIWVFKYKQS